MLDRLRVALLWSQIIRLSSQERLQECLKVLDKLSTRYPRIVSADIFKLSVRTSMEDFSYVAAQLPHVRERLRREKVDSPKRRYLLAFLAWLDGVANYQINQPSSPGKVDAIKLDFSDVDLRAVSKQTRRMFPLRVHPDWSSVEG